jgi:hypothetical protein
MKRYTAIGIVVILAMAVAGLSGCVKKEKQAVEQASQETKTPEAEKPTVIEALEAIRRAHPHSLQACYDKDQDAFFIEYAPLPDGAPADQFYHGWQYLKADKLFKSANGTWFTQERTSADYVLIYPDATSLPCKKT